MEQTQILLVSILPPQLPAHQGGMWSGNSFKSLYMIAKAAKMCTQCAHLVYVLLGDVPQCARADLAGRPPVWVVREP